MLNGEEQRALQKSVKNYFVKKIQILRNLRLSNTLYMKELQGVPYIDMSIES